MRTIFLSIFLILLIFFSSVAIAQNINYLDVNNGNAKNIIHSSSFSKYYISSSYEFWNLDNKITNLFNYYGSIVFHLGWKGKKRPTGLELSAIIHYIDKPHYFNNSWENEAFIEAGGLLLTGYYQFSFNSFYLNLGFVNALMSMVSYPQAVDYIGDGYKDDTEAVDYENFMEYYGDVTAWGYGFYAKALFDYQVWKKAGVSPYIGIRYIFRAKGESSKDFHKEKISLGGLSFSLGLEFYLKKY